MQNSQKTSVPESETWGLQLYKKAKFLGTPFLHNTSGWLVLEYFKEEKYLSENLKILY